MRTTLDIADDVLSTAVELAGREGCTTGKALSDLARRGLAAAASEQRNDWTMRAGVPVLPSRGEIVTLEHIRRLRNVEDV